MADVVDPQYYRAVDGIEKRGQRGKVSLFISYERHERDDGHAVAEKVCAVVQCGNVRKRDFFRGVTIYCMLWRKEGAVGGEGKQIIELFQRNITRYRSGHDRLGRFPSPLFECGVERLEEGVLQPFET